jgi:hypothetical protein
MTDVERWLVDAAWPAVVFLPTEGGLSCANVEAAEKALMAFEERPLGSALSCHRPELAPSLDQGDLVISVSQRGASGSSTGRKR